MTQPHEQIAEALVLLYAPDGKRAAVKLLRDALASLIPDDGSLVEARIQAALHEASIRIICDRNISASTTHTR